MIVACVASLILLTFATLVWMKSKSALADALATKNVLDLAEAITNKHAAALTTSRQLLTVIAGDGHIDDSKWIEERDFFIDQIIEPQVGKITNRMERLLAVRQMVDDATIEFASLQSSEPPVESATSASRAA